MTITLSGFAPTGTNPVGYFGLGGPSGRNPEAGASYSGAPAGSYALQVGFLIYTLAQTQAGGFSAGTTVDVFGNGWAPNAPVFTSGSSGGISNATGQTAVNGSQALPNGTYVTYWRVLTNASGATGVGGWLSSPSNDTGWVLGSQFTINYTIPTPTSVTPANGATAVTDEPTLTASATVGTEYNAPSVEVQFQIAADSGFTTLVNNIQETSYGNAHTASLVVPGSDNLTAGTWYLRARSVATTGEVSAWTATNTITISHPPTSTNFAPSGGQTVAYNGSGNAFTWTFTDTSPTDYQVKYEVLVQINSSGAAVADTGVVTSGVSSATIIIPTANKDTVLRWAVQVTDRDNVVGSYSPWQTFTVSDLPTVTVTAPSGSVTTPSPTVNWTFAASNGRTQARYRVTFAEQATPSTLLYDTGWVNGTATSFTPPSAVFSNGDSAVATVYVIDTAGLQKSVADNFTVSFTPPTAPSCTLTAQLDANGYVDVNWTGATVDSAFYSWRIYRSPRSANTWTLLGEILVSTTKDFHDYLAAASTYYDYAVVQVVTEFATHVESAKNVVTINSGGSTYWLISAAQPTSSVLLPQVKDDKFKDQRDQATMNLYGRGRRYEYGTHWGVSGTLTAQFRDAPYTGGKSPGLVALEALLNLEGDMYLRNPFGDIWRVGIQDPDITRIAGVGGRELADVGITYEQIATQ